jgi:hypothetical protein
VLRADIPDLGIEGACVSIIGALGESLGTMPARSPKGTVIALGGGLGR